MSIKTSKLRVHVFLLMLVLVACSSTPEQQAPVPTATSVAVAPTPATAPQATPVPAPPTPDPDVRLFPETGHTLQGAFRAFWEREGGLESFGLPISGAYLIDDVMVQYFERARFEGRADNVSLGRVGADLLQNRRGPIIPATPIEGCRYFEETHHNVCEPILTFWENAGGLARLGLPLEDVRQEFDKQTQFFERARIEVAEGQAPVLASIGAEALASVAGGTFLRSTELQPASQRALIIGQTMAAQPLDHATIGVRVPDYTGAAEVIIADRRGATGRYPIDITGGEAQVQVDVRGGLGPQAALVLIDGKVAGVGASALVVRAETAIQTGQRKYDAMVPIVKGFMDQSTSQYIFDGVPVHGYRSPDSDLLWLRDHVHQGKGYAYWERDMTSLLDQFRRFQHPDGYFDDYIANKSWGIVRGRTEVEADLEYLFIEGVYRAWQATGDDVWLRQQLDAMERGLSYIRNSPIRWDDQYQLVKRPFTVDTWDFEYGPPTIAPDGKLSPRHWIDEDTKWCIFHGDNTGYANSMELLARIYDYLDNPERAAYWREETAGIMERLNAVAWNGKFYRHMVHITPVTVPGVDEEQQLSLSNAYALSREGVGDRQAQAIIDEYYRRYVNRGTAFSEWFSIDPPFPAGSLSTSISMAPGWGQNPGEYVNGGLMPLVGGELARGAFFNGAEPYGFDILQRYYSLISTTGETYLWYYPIGNPGRSGSDTLATDGWGSSAMLAAVIEGAAGVEDNLKLFERATLSPRWTVAPDVSQANVVIRYGASDGYMAYQWERQPRGIVVRWTGSGTTTRLRLLLPTDAPEPSQAMIDGQEVTGMITTEGTSRYFEVDGAGSGTLGIAW